MRLEIEPGLTTERLLLRPFRGGDLEPLLAFLRDPRSTEHLLLTEHARTEAGAREMLQRLIESRAEEVPFLALALEARGPSEGGAWLGQVSLGLLPSARGGRGSSAELSYAVARAYEGRGFASEALEALSLHAEGALGLRELCLFVPLGHEASRRVGEKCGYRIEGERAQNQRRGWWMTRRVEP